MPAGFGVRLLANLVDAVVGFLLGLALAPSALGHYFSARAVVLLRIGEPDTWFQGPVAMILGIFGELVFLLPLTLVLAFLPEAVRGGSLGKRICRLRVASAEGGSARRYPRARFLVKTSPFWLSVIALVTGSWPLELLALGLGLVLLLAWLATSLVGAPPLHDRLAATMVIRRP